MHGQYVLGCCLRSDAHLDIVRKVRVLGLVLGWELALVLGWELAPVLDVVPVLDVEPEWALTMKRWLRCFRRHRHMQRGSK